ncbi:hypothetical protein HYT84_00350 [Candidatus Micrarchaeota archaeon]|nr:hypothetical protein [Candidatus Micrarchaeota archaeon]
MNEEEKIVIPAKMKKTLAKLAPLLGELGFNKINFKKDELSVEKAHGEDLQGKQYLHYRIVFGKKEILFIYSIPGHLSKRRRLIEVYPVLLNTLKIIEDYYEINAYNLVSPLLELLGELEKAMDKDVVDVSSELEDLKEKHNSLTKKYEDLVHSSEQNARILLEAERKSEEQKKRLEQLESLGDETLKEELFKWVKLHSGVIDLEQFCKAYNLPVKRAEEGLNNLIKEGYIKKKSD